MGKRIIMPKAKKKRKKRKPREVPPRYVEQKDWDNFLAWTLACVYVACQKSYDDLPVFPAELLSMKKRGPVSKARRVLHRTLYDTVGQKIEGQRVLIVVCPEGRPESLKPISTPNMGKVFGGDHSTFVMQRVSKSFKLLSPLPLNEVREAREKIDEQAMKLIKQTAVEDEFPKDESET